jgi:NADH-quinone oxidoreductase subunit J
METWLFYIFAGIASAAAINVLAQRRVFYSAISLIICLCALAGIYLLLEAPFIAAVQIIVYAGAIMVVFLFVIMLLDPQSAGPVRDKRKHLAYLGILLGTAAFALLHELLKSYRQARIPQFSENMGGGSLTVQHLGESLFREYLVPFEITSILILVAIMGVVVLAKKKA